MGNPAYQFIAGFANPEDLAPIPGTRWIIASGMGDQASGQPGALYLIDRVNRGMRTIWPNSPERIAPSPEFPDFPAPVPAASFMTHGISLESRPDGSQRLYAVNHGERESIEIFDLLFDAGDVELAWIGGVGIPYPSHGNAVATLNDGTILMSCIYRLDDPDFGPRIARGENTGYLMSWQRGRGWLELEGSHSNCPNGLIVADDGGTVFSASTGTGTLLRAKIDQDRSKLSDAVTLDLGFAPDNLRWNEDGSICAAGFASLSDPAPRACRIDPVTLAASAIPLPPHWPEFEYVATGVTVGRELWLSVYQGDKVAVLPLD